MRTARRRMILIRDAVIAILIMFVMFVGIAVALISYYNKLRICDNETGHICTPYEMEQRERVNKKN